ncbi:hypothetical protein ACKWTF_007089 [Chironomus riparius]
MEDGRNFRSIYYEKVGCRSVEEKKSLEILLKENPVFKAKLLQFLKLFSVPSVHRGLLYNLALDVYPIYMESKEFVMQQKKETYEDLIRALDVMKYIDDRTPKSRVFYAMYLLETKKLNSSANLYRDSVFSLLAEVILEGLEADPVESYFITKSFYRFSEDISNELPKLKHQTHFYLEKEEEEIYRHLNSRSIIDKLPFDRWYPSIFSSILDRLALIRIFDKVASGSISIVVFLFVVICSYTRFQLKSPKIDTDEVIKIIESYAVEDDSQKSEVIINKSIDLWQKYCMKK